MNKNFDYNKFEKIIRVTQVISKIIFIASIVALSACALAFLIIAFLPSHLLNIDVNQFTLEIGDALKYEFNKTLLIGKNIKFILLTAIFSGSISAGLFAFLMNSVKSILEDVKNQMPFSENNVKHLFRVAYTILVSSVLIPVMNFALASIIILHFDISNFDVELPIELSMVFIGFLMLILAHIFRYGAYLQNEYDQTL
jgi:Protein of unknown function (DUF2975)